jgi:hypothetical protein
MKGESKMKGRFVCVCEVTKVHRALPSSICGPSMDGNQQASASCVSGA